MATSYAFVFRAYPDVDHIAPIAWKLLDGGEQVYGIVSPGYRTESDYRLAFLGTYPGFQLVEVAPAREDVALAGRTADALRGLVRRTLPWTMWFLARRRVQLVGVEWGYGLNAGYARLLSPRGVLAVIRSFAGSLRRLRDPRQVRTNFVVAARILGRSSVCLPHGLSVKVGRHSTPDQQLGGACDWQDRNRFSAYVLNTEHHRKWFLEHAGGDAKVMQTWGSVRWSPEWFELNRELAPPFAWPSNGKGRRSLNVVFMVPKWHNHVDQPATLELVRRLQELDFVSLAVKGHPRPAAGSADPLREHPAIDWERVHDVTGADSVSVIAAADVVIDVGSSIGLETVMQNKVLLNPVYIHDFRTLFDEVPGSCVVAHSAEGIVGYLRTHAAGAPHRVYEAAHRELLRRGVYAGRPEPFDVLGDYRERVRSLAHADSPPPVGTEPRPLAGAQPQTRS